MDKDQLLEYLQQLNDKMKQHDIRGEIHVYGGAVMCIALEARLTTRDIDAWFVPAHEIRELAVQVAHDNDIEEDWLNDGVKGFLSENDNTEEFLNLSNLKVFCAKPEYALAMKCMAARTDEDARDIEDIEFLLNYLHITDYESAEKILLKYFSPNMISIKTQLLLEEILQND